MNDKDIAKVAANFEMSSPPYKISPLGDGLVNTTFSVTTTSSERFVLQKISAQVFSNPAAMILNVASITSYLADQLNPNDPDRNRKVLSVILAKSHLPYYIDSDGVFWRMTRFIPGVTSPIPHQAKDMYLAGQAFGNFQMALKKYPVDQLSVTIPNFHNTPHRFAQLHQAIAAAILNQTKNPKLSRRLAQTELLVADYLSLGAEFQTRLVDSKLPLRATHNDTKLNNVLLDSVTREPVCVIDLDTVMPGLAAYDFGDAIRFGASTTPEDEPGELDFELFESFAMGFVQNNSLTQAEKTSLSMGALIMTLECGSRFLTDYLSGDSYFKISAPDHNLRRAEAQLSLAKNIKARLDEMNSFVLGIR